MIGALLCLIGLHDERDQMWSPSLNNMGFTECIRCGKMFNEPWWYRPRWFFRTLWR